MSKRGCKYGTVHRSASFKHKRRARESKSCASSEVSSFLAAIFICLAADILLQNLLGSAHGLWAERGLALASRKAKAKAQPCGLAHEPMRQQGLGHERRAVACHEPMSIRELATVHLLEASSAQG